MCTSSLKCKDMAYPMTLTLARQRSVRAPEHSAPSTMASNIATVTGSVLTTGIASFLCKPCTFDFTKVDSVGEGTLAIWRTHKIALNACFTANLGWAESAMFCKQSKEGLLYWKHSNAVGNGRAYYTVHRKILEGEKLTNCKLFAKIFFANTI